VKTVMASQDRTPLTAPARRRLLALLAATATAARFTARHRQVGLIFALAGLVLSFVPVVAIEATGLRKAVLAAQHLLVAAIVIPVFACTLPHRT